jgi:predicted DNA-binding protein
MSGTRKGAAEALKRFPLDLSDEDRARLEDLAARHSRTMAGQIRWLIRQAAEQEQRAA